MLPEINIVAVIDDNDEAARTMEMDIEDCDLGYRPVVISPQAANNNEQTLVKMILDAGAQGVFCDHRLNGSSHFHGAAIIASLYDKKIPGVLITTFFNHDNDHSIRKYRRRVPVLLKRSDAEEPEVLKEKMDICAMELFEETPMTRRPHRAIIRIVDIYEKKSGDMLEVIVPSWDPNEAVLFPKILIPEKLCKSLGKGVRLIANVNTGAQTQDDLYFENFELAPEPVPENELA